MAILVLHMPQGDVRTNLAASRERGSLTRLPNVDQWLHDRVVETIAAQANGYVAYTNLGGHHTVCLVGDGRSRNPREVCPDLILSDPASFLVDHVVEVETEDSIRTPAVQRWIDIAHAIHRRGQFWILVPAARSALAAQLCRQYGIPAKIGTWSADSQGVLVSWPAPLRAPAYRP